MSKFEAAVKSAVRDLADLDASMWSEVAATFGCAEANVIADLLTAVGLEEHAVILLTAHYVELNEADDTERRVMHSEIFGGELDSRIQPEIYATV